MTDPAARSRLLAARYQDYAGGLGWLSPYSNTVLTEEAALKELDEAERTGTPNPVSKILGKS